MDKGDGGLNNLLAQGYNVLNDLNKAADVAVKQKVLMRNGQLAQAKAKDLITNLHRMVDAFDGLLQTFITGVVKDRNDVLVSHSKEIIENVEYITDLCTMSERLLSEKSDRHTLVEIQAQFMQILQECDDLKYVDYDTFTSVDLEVDLQDLFKAPLAKIISRNSKHLERHTLHSLGFGDLITHAGEERPMSSGNQDLVSNKSSKLSTANIAEADSGFEKSNVSIVDLTSSTSETDVVQPHIDLTQNTSDSSLPNDDVANESCAIVVKSKSAGNKSASKSKREVHVRPCYMDQEVEKTSVTNRNLAEPSATGADSLNWRDSISNKKASDNAPSRADCPNWREKRVSQDQHVMREPSETTLSILAEQKKVLASYRNMKENKKPEKSSEISSNSAVEDWQHGHNEIQKKNMSVLEKITSLLPSNTDSDPEECLDLPPSLKPCPKTDMTSQSQKANKGSKEQLSSSVTPNKKITSLDEVWDLPPSLQPSPKKGSNSEETNSTDITFKGKKKDPGLPDLKFSLSNVITTSVTGLKGKIVSK